MINSVKNLGLKKLFVVYPGEKLYPLDENVEAVGLKSLARILPEIV